MNSYYLALSWNRAGNYQLFKFSLALPKPEQLTWDFPEGAERSSKVGKRLRGRDQAETLFEWYGESGGQLKYYPRVEHALWKSEIFRLEPLPENEKARFGVLAKARSYFPKLWDAISRGD
jgi:hypothetical protein